MENRRKLKNLFVGPAIKIGAVIYVAVIVLFGAELFLLNHFYNLMQENMYQYEATGAVPIIQFMEKWQHFNMIHVMVLTAITAATFLIAVWYCHKIVGPILKFERNLRQLVSEGRLPETVLRKGDYFQEMAELLNHLAKKKES